MYRYQQAVPRARALSAYRTAGATAAPEPTLDRPRGLLRGARRISAGPIATKKTVPVPRPLNERHSLEQERAELSVSLTVDHRKLEVTPTQNRTRREFLMWRIKNTELRLATIEARLAAIHKAERG